MNRIGTTQVVIKQKISKNLTTIKDFFVSSKIKIFLIFSKRSQQNVKASLKLTRNYFNYPYYSIIPFDFLFLEIKFYNLELLSDFHCDIVYTF